jgi:hypothetical protein
VKQISTSGKSIFIHGFMIQLPLVVAKVFLAFLQYLNWGTLSLVVKQTEYEAEYSPLSSSTVKSVWSIS